MLITSKVFHSGLTLYTLFLSALVLSPCTAYIQNWNYTSEKIIVYSNRAVVPVTLASMDNTASGNVVQLSVYMESQCPDTTDFFKRQLLPMWRRLGATQRVNISIVPFGKASCRRGDNDFNCECQHGSRECELNQLMNCVIDRFPNPSEHMLLLGCIQGGRGLNRVIDRCFNGHPLNSWLLDCAQTKKGRELHYVAGEKTALIPELDFVPWVIINGERVQDAFYALEENICKRLQAPKPSQCTYEEFITIPASRPAGVIVQPMLPISVPVSSVPPDTGNVIEMTVFTEALCADTTDFFKQQLIPMWQKFGQTRRVNVRVIPYGLTTCVQKNNDFSCECQHGSSECELNQLMNCVIDRLPRPSDHMLMLGCIQGGSGLKPVIDRCFRGHYLSEWLWNCARTQKGRRLLYAAGQRMSTFSPSIQSVPLVEINGETVQQSTDYSLEQSICRRFRMPIPVECVR